MVAEAVEVMLKDVVKAMTGSVNCCHNILTGLRDVFLLSQVVGKVQAGDPRNLELKLCDLSEKALTREAVDNTRHGVFDLGRSPLELI